MTHLPPEQNKVIAGAISRYLEEHSQAPVLLKTISKHLGYSVPWIRTVFKRETGKSIIDHLLFLRIQRAKRLLRNTDLDITKIALEVGFSSYTRFAIAFKKRTGISGKEFRNLSETGIDVSPPVDLPTKSGAEIIRFRDSFSGPALNDCWKPISGIWSQQSGMLAGRSDQELMLTCNRFLPDNFRLSLEFLPLNNPFISLLIHGEDPGLFDVKVELGKYGNQMGVVTFKSIVPGQFAGVWVRSGEWQRLDLELQENQIKLHVGSGEAFAFRAPFSPAVSLRPRFSIWGWNGVLQIRNVEIRNLGFTPIISPIRQADGLYNTNIFDRALRAYMGLLEMASQEQQIQELQYKIGACFLKQEAFGQAEAWFHKVFASEKESFWAACAQSALLEIKRIRGEIPLLIENARTMFQRPSQQEIVRANMAFAMRSLVSRGQFAQALQCGQAWFDLEQPGTLRASLAERHLPDVLFQLRRYDDAALHLRRIIADLSVHEEEDVNQSKISLSDVLSYAGRTCESEELIAEARAKTKNEHVLQRCDIAHAINLRGQQRFDEAIRTLLDMPSRYANTGALIPFAMGSAANVHCILGETTRAKELVTDAKKRNSAHVFWPTYFESRFEYPPLFLEGNFAQAADVLLSSAFKGSDEYLKASQMVRAGILFELGGNRPKALHTWEDTEKMFPAKHHCFFGTLASHLAKNQCDGLEEMPFAAIHRAEMFYLAGRLLTKRGEKEMARKFYKLSVADDPTLNWFTWMARKEVASRA